MIDVEKWAILVREARTAGRPLIEVPTEDLDRLLAMKIKVDSLREQCQMVVDGTAEPTIPLVRAQRVLEWLA
jgi:hypothetical protein